MHQTSECLIHPSDFLEHPRPSKQLERQQLHGPFFHFQRWWCCDDTFFCHWTIQLIMPQLECCLSETCYHIQKGLLHLHLSQSYSVLELPLCGETQVENTWMWGKTFPFCNTQNHSLCCIFLEEAFLPLFSHWACR